MDTKKFLIITWMVLALLVGIGIGYLLGIKGIGQQERQMPQGQGFGPGQQQGPAQMMPQQQGGQQGQPVNPNQQPQR